MKADYHLHTEFSDDSTNPMENVILEAIEKQLDEICFTDHVDYGVKCDFDEDRSYYDERFGKGNYRINTNYPLYFAKIAELSNKYQQTITIRKGLEFGVQPKEIERYEKLFAQYPLDFVILSVHEIDDLWLFKWIKNQSDQKQYNLDYYANIYECMKKYDNYSVLGHLDQIKRYDPKGSLPFNEIKEACAEILKLAIQKEKGIEINTSTCLSANDEPMPSFDIIKLYYDLGGRIITLGSDSHKPNAVANSFDLTREKLKAIGFREFCTFDRMKPIFHEL